MMRSLWSAVSGLNTHQLEMDVIGNNISNVNTTAFKSSATGFQDVLYQTIKNSGAPGDNRFSTNADQVGLGAKMGSIFANISKQGSAVMTNNVFDLMINGDSFFVISPDSTTQNFSRDGSFTIDAEGDLVTQNNGYYVMGVMGDGGVADGAAVTKIKVIERQAMPDKNDPTVMRKVDYMPGAPTEAAYMKGNIDSEDPALKEGKGLMLEIYGNDGNPYTLKYKIDNAGDDDISTFNLTLSSIVDSEGKIVMSKAADPITLVYDKHNGRLLSAPTIQVTLSGDDGTLGSFELDLSNTTNFASSMASHSSSIYAYKGDTEGLRMGYPEGELTGISFGDDGSIYGRYSNGQTVKKAQIAVAEFSNAMGLEQVGNNLYAQSLNSGTAQIMDITRNGGYLNSGYLEGSNVDLAKEFTDMITTQRGFQANSRVITTSDEMLQILKGLKR